MLIIAWCGSSGLDNVRTHVFTEPLLQTWAGSNCHFLDLKTWFATLTNFQFHMFSFLLGPNFCNPICSCKWFLKADTPQVTHKGLLKGDLQADPYSF